MWKSPCFHVFVPWIYLRIMTSYTMKNIFYSILLGSLLASCSSREKADLLVYNALIYTVDSSFATAEAMVLSGGKIIETGTAADLKKKYDATDQLDAQGKFIYPGFIDAHAHFVGYANSLQRVDLTGTNSWQEVADRSMQFAAQHPDGWLVGRGWDQNDWDIRQFPDNKKLNELFPNRPVLLTRIDGHAAIANQKALEIAGIKAGDVLTGGEIETRNGQLTGILIDNAVDLVSAKIPDADAHQARKALLDAQQNCFTVGLTTVDDCGLDYDETVFIDSLQKTGELKMRIYAMLSDKRKNFELAFSKGPIKTDRLNVRSFKVYADGALGSRGACLLAPYQDKPGWSGFLLSSLQHFDSVAAILLKNDFQMCTHAIGDSGNRAILNIYSKYLKGKNDRRWRIEHAQVVNQQDFNLFGQNNVIPSVQPTHATSDMYWAGDRLGHEREKGAYAYKQLLQQNGWIPLGTDFPVEDISPFKTFYAAVIRKDAKGWPEKGYQAENSLTRQEALKGMTIWAARANFEEQEKGSLEKGKFADFVILDTDLINAPPENLLKIKVLKTFLNGNIVYENR
jgi:predicted amidohydrolase YtcJ